MKITKLGHCCMVIEEGGLKILTDPGNYSEAQNSVTGITHVFITHEHQDHCHVPSLKQVLANNPSAVVYTNSAVGKLLAAEGIPYVVLEHGGKQTLGTVEVEGFGAEHREMYPGMPNAMNTGYFFGNQFFYPGDAFTEPGVPVQVLALPIAAPWLKMAEAIDYAKAVKPQVCFPVHDGNYSSPPGSIKNLPPEVLEPAGVKYQVLELGKQYEF